MRKLGRVTAYIDGANLDKAARALGWRFDYRRFRVWLREKRGADRAVLFLGYRPEFSGVYAARRGDGYEIEFREITIDPATGKVKGNCDADLVLRAAVDCCEGAFGRAVIVSSDGDYAGLVKFLMARGALEVLVSPAPWRKCSMLLKRLDPPLVYLDEIRDAVEAEASPKKKSPQ